MTPRRLTTESGASVADNQNSQTAGPDGPVLIQDHHLIEKLARFNRERIPERVVHARGSGAFGHFEVSRGGGAWKRGAPGWLAQRAGVRERALPVEGVGARTGPGC